MLNVATETGNAKMLRDILVLSDKYRDPQGYVLAYDNAYKVAESIAKDGDDLYLRAKNAAISCCDILNDADSSKLVMSKFEIGALNDAKASLDAMTDESDTFMSDSLEKYKAEVAVFRPDDNYKF
jgi:methanol--5-hydroxybenzimidazolylcobamide Co-methyltransferase